MKTRGEGKGWRAGNPSGEIETGPANASRERRGGTRGGGRPRRRRHRRHLRMRSRIAKGDGLRHRLSGRITAIATRESVIGSGTRVRGTGKRGTTRTGNCATGRFEGDTTLDGGRGNGTSRGKVAHRRRSRMAEAGSVRCRLLLGKKHVACLLLGNPLRMISARNRGLSNIRRSIFVIATA